MGGLTEVPEALLTERERSALAEHARRGAPAMSPATAANFFALFVEGYTLDQMLEANRAWGLGVLVDARIRYRWDERREAYVEDVHKQAVERLAKLRAESINHLANLAAVAHTEFRQDMIRYLQNPTEDNLPKGRLRTPKDYRDLIEAIEKVTKLGVPTPPPSPTVGVSVGEGSQVAIVMADEKGAQILQKLANARRKRDTGDKS
jgi:hypothetical protein